MNTQIKHTMVFTTLLLLTHCCHIHAFTPTPLSSVQSIQRHHHHTNNRNVQTFSYIDLNSHHKQKDYYSQKRYSSRTRLNMVATPTPSGAAALVGVISGGILGGALHAIAGMFILL